MLHNSLCTALSLIFLNVLSNNAMAGVIVNTETCTEASATLDSLYLSDFNISANTGGATGANLLSQSYDATSCIGLFNGNDTQVPVLGNNIGQYGDGLLNGGIFFNGPYEDDHLSGLEFITLDDLQDVDGDNEYFPGPGVAEGRDDPGWIQLAKFEDTELADSSTNASYYNWLNVIELAISDVLRLTFQCDAGCTSIAWTLATDKDIVTSVQNILGESTFDHLAFSIKSGNSSNEDLTSTGGWGIYDFNFKQIFQDEIANGNLIFDDPSAFTTAFVLGGTLDLGYDFYTTNGKGERKARGISHLTVWARDPAETITTIQEPTTIALIGLSLVFFATRKVIKKK